MRASPSAAFSPAAIDARPLLGRHRELRTLMERAALAATGEGTVVEVVGEAGIGKTFLLDHVTAQLGARGATVLRGRASEFERDVPYGAVTDALPELHDLLSVTTDDARAYAVHQHVRRLLRERADAARVVLALDDTHWADPATAALLRSLIDRPEPGRILLILAHRPHQLDSALGPGVHHGEARGVERIVLDPIDLADAGELLQHRLPPREVAELHTACGGNPFYLQHLAKHHEGRVPIGEQSSGLVSTGPGWPLASELAPLSHEARQLLNAASVVGDPFEVGLAQAVAVITSDGDAFAALDQLLAADLVRTTERPRWFAFRHPLVRRMVYDATGAGWRITAHHRAAAELHAAGAGPTTQAHHVEQCAVPGDHAAIELLTTAGSHTVRAAPATAARWLETAWNLTPEDRRTDPAAMALLRSLVVALTSSGQGERAIALTTALVETVGDNPIRSHLELGLALTEVLDGRLPKARVRLRDLVARAGETPGPDVFPVLLMLANLDSAGADFAAARRSVDAALEIARSTELPVLRAFARSIEAPIAAAQGDVAVAAAACDEAAEALTELDAAAMEHMPTVLGALARGEWHLGRFEAAKAHLAQGIAATRGGQWPVLAVNLRSFAAMIDLAVGDVRQAAAAAEAAAEEAALVHNYEATIWAELARAATLEPTSSVDRAIHAAERALQLARDHALHNGVAAAGLELARALVATGLPARALDVLMTTQGGPAFSRAIPLSRTDGFAIATAAASALGDQAGARGWAERAAEAAATAPLALMRAQAAAAQATVLIEVDARAAVEHAEEGVTLALGVGAMIEVSRLRLLAAQGLIGCGDRNAAIALLRLVEADCASSGADRLQALAVRGLRQVGRRVTRGGRGPLSVDLSKPTGADGIATLTQRQAQVCRLAAAGRTNRAIAEEMFLSVKAVEGHLSAAYLKLGVRSRRELPASLG